jgi:DNA-directed RNA polymerase subunit RPC12/RpoP
MADTIEITCKECGKQMKAAATLKGKKIRCKGCGGVVLVKGKLIKAAAVVEKPVAPVDDRPKSAKEKLDEEFADNNPYEVTALEEGHRCPHCANELESADAVICLHCGYNTMTREWAKTVKTVESTGLDWTLWLLPGIFCALLVFAFAGGIFFLWVFAKDIIEDNKEEWWAFAPRAMQLWGTIFALACIFFSGRFAVKRLIFNYRPPEKIKTDKGVKRA